MSLVEYGCRSHYQVFCAPSYQSAARLSTPINQSIKKVSKKSSKQEQKINTHIDALLAGTSRLNANRRDPRAARLQREYSTKVCWNSHRSSNVRSHSQRRSSARHQRRFSATASSGRCQSNPIQIKLIQPISD